MMRYLFVAATAVVVLDIATAESNSCGAGDCASDDEAKDMQVSMLQRNNKVAIQEHEHGASVKERRVEILTELAEIEKQLADQGEPAPNPELSRDAYEGSQTIYVNINDMFHTHSRITIGSGPNSVYTVTSKRGSSLNLAEPVRERYSRGTSVCGNDNDQRCNDNHGDASWEMLSPDGYCSPNRGSGRYQYWSTRTFFTPELCKWGCENYGSRCMGITFSFPQCRIHVSDREGLEGPPGNTGFETHSGNGDINGVVASHGKHCYKYGAGSGGGGFDDHGCRMPGEVCGKLGTVMGKCCNNMECKDAGNGGTWKCYSGAAPR